MANIVRDKAKLTELWSPSLLPWFPEGIEDLHIAAIRFVPMRAELWDGSGIRGLSVLFESVKAVFRGRRADLDGMGVHQQVAL